MKRWNLFLLLAVLAITAVIYGSLWEAGPLTWDDDSNIFANPYFTMHMWWGVWTEPYFGLFVPVISSAWAGLFTLGAGHAWPFRLFNLTLHLINSVLVYQLLRGLARRWNIQSPVALGLAVAVFALHPLQAEAVAWISGGRDLLSTFFALSGALVYYGWPKRGGYFLAMLLFALGLLSKPGIVVLPLAFMAVDVWIFGKAWRSTLLKMLPWFALSLVATIFTQAAQVDHFVDTVAWGLRPWIVADTYSFYLQKLFWPVSLSANYDHTPEKIVANPAGLWRVAVFLIGLLTAAVLAWKYDRRFWLGSLWFILLIPVTGIVAFAYENISVVADHYLYLPMAVVAGILMLVCEELWRWRAFMILPLLLIGSWSWATWNRLQVWENDTNFFTDMAEKAPDSYSAAMGMSVVLCQDQKNYEAGLVWTDKALRLRENDILALANRAFCLLQSGHIKEVIDMDFYLAKLDTKALGANQPTAFSSLLASIGNALMQEHDYENGFQYLCEAYRVKPSEPNHLHNLQVATEMLKQEGLAATCEEGEDDDPPPADLINQLLQPPEEGEQ